MLLMRHDDRASFGRALEDLDCRKRHAAGTIVEAFRNLSVRPDLAELDRDAEFLMSRLPPIEGYLIDAERVGHFLVDPTNPALGAAGVLDYVSSNDRVSPLGKTYTENLIREAAHKGRMALAYHEKGFPTLVRRFANEVLGVSLTERGDAVV